MALDWSAVGSIGSAISGIGSAVTGYKLGEIQKKYQKKFYLLEQQKAQADQEAQKQLIEIEKQKLQSQLETETEGELRRTDIFENFLASLSREAGELQKPETIVPVLVVIGVGVLVFMMKKKRR